MIRRIKGDICTIENKKDHIDMAQALYSFFDESAPHAPLAAAYAG